MSKLLTHQNTKLTKSELKELCSKSSEIKMMLGFFYFSSVKMFYNILTEHPDIKLRVLVGMDIENVLDRVFECIITDCDEFGTEYGRSNNDIRDQYIESLRKVLNSPSFDKENFYERVDFFVKLIKEDRLILRKTRRENQEKLMIFDMGKETDLLNKYPFITGSSNFTLPGFKQFETMVDLSINEQGEEVNQVFEELWDNSVALTEDLATKQRILDLFEKESMVSQVTPFEAYILALKTYLDMQSQVNMTERMKRSLEKAGYKSYKYQLDAVNQALTVLNEYNGVILADVVGLGKSIIASLVALGTGKRGIIICPPGLMGNESNRNSGWLGYKNQFKLDGFEVFSCGKLEDAFNFVKEDPDREVVIIDEAHRFKNQDTLDYEILSNICRGRQVILLTATPFNNKPADIFALLKLFIVPFKSKITLDNFLASRFASYDRVFKKLAEVQKYHNTPKADKQRLIMGYYKELYRQFMGIEPERNPVIDLTYIKEWSRKLAYEIKHILEPVIIRRNRIDLRNDIDYKEEVTDLSDMQNPVEQFFELTKEQSDFYDKVIGQYFCDDGEFKGAIYRPFAYEKKSENDLDQDDTWELSQQTNLYDFMKRILVRRFESSFGAFAKSLENFLNSHKKAFEFVKTTHKFVHDRKLLEKIYNSSEDEIQKALEEYEQIYEQDENFKGYKVYNIDEFARGNEFLVDIESDIHLFEDLIAQVKKLDLATNDPKAARLANSLFAVMNGTHENIPVLKGEANRKVIVFSEYTDTINHLAEYLETKFPGKVLKAVGSISNAMAETIEKNFDASYKGTQENEYQVLLATDKMSEGHNLNRAGLVINYDIPWNPIRVIQRVGRINRIGKKVFQNLYIFNFFPTEKGSTIAKSREIASAKMFMIHNTIGEDAKIFDIDETPSPASLYQKVQQNPDEMEQENFITTIKKELRQVEQEHPEIMERVNKYPYRVKTAKQGEENELILFRKKGLGLFSLSVDENTSKEKQITVEEALQKLKCPVDEPRLNLSDKFWDSYKTAKSFQPFFIGGSGNSNSIEGRAKENLQSALEYCNKNQRTDLTRFIENLLDDIYRYGTLPDYTIRRLARIDLFKKPEKMDDYLKVISELKMILGEDFLQKLKANLRYKSSEIIIAEELIQNKIDVQDEGFTPQVCH